MARLKLTLACQPYDWTKPVMDGSIQPDGIEIAAEVSRPAQTFERLFKNREFDVAEMGLRFYLAMLEADPNAYIAIPVFPVRLFRLASIYVNVESPIRSARDLAGKRFGEVHTLGHDAGIWARGILRDYHGVSFDTHASYFVGGVERASRKWDWLPGDWPAKARAEHIGPERTLDTMLEANEIDVLFSVVEPPGLRRRPPSVRHLFTDIEALERDYYRQSGVFPIMHTVVIRSEIARQHPWVPRAIYNAFLEAKQRVAERERVQEYVPFTHMLPLYTEHQREIIALMGEDFWPYGFAPNRRTLDTFLGYHHDLGLSGRRFGPEGLFLPDSLTW